MAIRFSKEGARVVVADVDGAATSQISHTASKGAILSLGREFVVDGGQTAAYVTPK